MTKNVDAIISRIILYCEQKKQKTNWIHEEFFFSGDAHVPKTRFTTENPRKILSNFKIRNKYKNMSLK